MTRTRQLPLWLAGFVASAAALAQLPDPTRPAAALMTQDLAGGVGAAADSGVRTVILRPAGKSAAVVDGQYVEVGGKLGDMRVLKITESEVVLAGESGREVLKATPAIEKVPARKKAAAKRRTRENTGK